MNNPDRLYDLVPTIYRQRDAEKGFQLQALLRVIAEQVNTVENDITQLYENWFIETCDDWVVPYIGDLLGYELLNDTGEPGNADSVRTRERERIVIPRRDVANTIRARRRKGTRMVLDELALDVAAWPARAVEFYRLLGWTQNLHTLRLGEPRHYIVRIGDTAGSVAARYRMSVHHLLWLNPTLNRKTHPGDLLIVGTRLLVGWRRARGETANLRDGDALELLDGPFDSIAHTVDVRRICSQRTVGRYNIPSVGVFVWRLKSYSVTRTPACCVEEEGPHCYTFSVLGNNTALFNHPQTDARAAASVPGLDLPTAISRRQWHRHLKDYYGDQLSVAIWAPDWPKKGSPQPIPASAIVAANLDNWQYRPKQKNELLVDPVLGRIVFPPDHLPKRVSVLYHYGFSADIGGGEYTRTLSQPSGAKIYRVGAGETFDTIGKALNQWIADKQPPAPVEGAPGDQKETTVVPAVIEITDSSAYTDKIAVELGVGEYLQIRAASGARPVLRLLDYSPDQQDALTVSGGRGSRFVIDGLLITGRGLVVQGPEIAAEEKAAEEPGDLCDVTIRHCTLVPGWGLNCDCEPRRPSEPSIELSNTTAAIRIEHSILGAILVVADQVQTDPVCISISDSIWDATDNELAVLSGPGDAMAFTRLTVLRSTVFGEVQSHEIALAENSIFDGCVCVARRQRGCVRFCYVSTDSRTPRRYECQPDLVLKAVADKFLRSQGTMSPMSDDERDTLEESEQLRVVPIFNNTYYGSPTYAQLADACAQEIKTGADDESEMGAFHDLYQPQRAANLLTRLEEYIPAGMDAGIICAT